jgi:Kef-type K+ transport system membrane component KefB
MPLGIAGEHRPIVEFAAELGKLLLMFFCGLEINLALFRQTQSRSIAFGLVTTLIPLLLGAAVGFSVGYGLIGPSSWDRCWHRTRSWRRPSWRSSA